MTSVCNTAGLGQDALPEIAVVGRSNVGKSSLINALCSQKGLAKTSKTPGRTSALNYFKIVLAEYEDKTRTNSAEGYLVDLPGYGYAAVSKAERKRWDKLIQEYFFNHNALKGILLLQDSRRDMKDEERWFLDIDLDIPTLIALTKVDKISKNQLKSKISEISNELSIPETFIIPTSVLSGKKTGLEDLIQAMAEILISS